MSKVLVLKDTAFIEALDISIHKKLCWQTLQLAVPRCLRFDNVNKSSQPYKTFSTSLMRMTTKIKHLSWQTLEPNRIFVSKTSSLKFKHLNRVLLVWVLEPYYQILDQAGKVYQEKRCSLSEALLSVTKKKKLMPKLSNIFVISLV